MYLRQKLQLARNMLLTFIAVNLIMGLKPKRNTNLYWKVDDKYHRFAVIQSLMKRECYYEI